MDHVVYLDTKASEFEKLLNGRKTMIIRGATGRKLPYGRVSIGDILYLINNNAEGMIKAKGTVTSVFNSDKLSPNESKALVTNHQATLQLTNDQFNRWVSKRYLVLIGLKNIEPVDPFAIDRSAYGNMDDWLPVADINTVRKN